jgi:hypothetical protein
MQKLNPGSPSRKRIFPIPDSELHDHHLVEMFLQWLRQCPPEHQLELAEFIGYLCYEKLYGSLETMGEKIYACTEYLKSYTGDEEKEEKLLLFINDIMEFIVEINEIADNSLFASEEIIYALSDIVSLYSLINELPQRSMKWLVTYHKWLAFKKDFPFFNIMNEPYQGYNQLKGDLKSHLRRHLKQNF